MNETMMPSHELSQEVGNPFQPKIEVKAESF